MPTTYALEVDPDGTRVEVETTDDGVSVRRVLDKRQQPADVRARDEAVAAGELWQLLADLHTALTAGGQAYWNQVAPDAGLPATTGAYNTAMAFLTARRDKAMSRALAAINRWRTA